MNTLVHAIPASHLMIAFIPVGLVLFIIYKWSLDFRYSLYALSRMLIQLLLIGYVLHSIFSADNAWLVLLVLFIMAVASSWIALGTVKQQRRHLYYSAFLSILLGGGLTIILISQFVLTLQPWYQPHYLIPLAGMTFANAMNSVSLASERLYAELGRDQDFHDACRIAFNAAFIPVINAMLAVGLVSLPGMMTGQILSGVSPVVAAHYQIVVMCMIFGSAGLSTALFLILIKEKFQKT